MHLYTSYRRIDLPKIALTYHTGKHYYQNVMSLIAIITDISLFSMTISIYPDRRRFELVIILYLNLIGYLLKHIQVFFYHALTVFCCYGGCQQVAAWLM